MYAHLVAPAAEMSQRRLAEPWGIFAWGDSKQSVVLSRATTIVLRLWLSHNISCNFFIEHNLEAPLVHLTALRCRHPLGWMSAYGTKRTYRAKFAMSAFGGKAGMV